MFKDKNFATFLLVLAILGIATSLPVDPKPKKPEAENEIPDTGERLEVR